jgi:hypothetical protein
MRTLPKCFRDFRIRYPEISAASDALGEAVTPRHGWIHLG